MQLGGAVKSAQAKAQVMENHLLALILANVILLGFTFVLNVIALYLNDTHVNFANQIIVAVFVFLALLSTFGIGGIAFGGDLIRRLWHRPTDSFMA